MPLSDLYRMARGSLESSQQKPISTSIDLSHLPENDEFVELVWENGQIMIQGQSSKTRKNTNSNNFQSPTPKFRDRDLVNTSNPKTGRYGLMGSSTMHDFTATVPSSNLGLDQDDDMAPWLNYVDPLQSNYCPDFLPEVSSVTVTDFPHQNNIASTDKKCLFNPQPSSGGFSNTSSGIINFTHFSKPIVLARADTRNVNTVDPADKMSLSTKGNYVPISNEMGSNSQPKLVPKTVSESQGNVSREDAVRNNVPPHQVDVAVSSKGIREGDKNLEPVVASSSVCSGNNPEQTSDDQNHDLKRKSRETDDSEGRSEDVEEESVGVRKAASARGGTSTKRSRAAEVHNLSERRRRDRINEKMRALQELIPNCNKVDKASMLDEAIEYLKTLQLQVQMMSMGAGLYMPHMMLPTGMQHVPAQYPPMMGVGMGFGMGMLDMNGGMRFHGSRPMPFSGPTNFPMMAGPGPNLPGFGPVSLPCQPSFPIAAGSTNPGMNYSFRVEIPSSTPLPAEGTNDGFGHSPLPSKNDEVPVHAKDVLPS